MIEQSSSNLRQDGLPVTVCWSLMRVILLDVALERGVLSEECCTCGTLPECKTKEVHTLNQKRIYMSELPQYHLGLWSTPSTMSKFKMYKEGLFAQDKTSIGISSSPISTKPTKSQPPCHPSQRPSSSSPAVRLPPSNHYPTSLTPTSSKQWHRLRARSPTPRKRHLPRPPRRALRNKRQRRPRRSPIPQSPRHRRDAPPRRNRRHHHQSSRIVRRKDPRQIRHSCKQRRRRNAYRIRPRTTPRRFRHKRYRSLCPHQNPSSPPTEIECCAHRQHLLRHQQSQPQTRSYDPHAQALWRAISCQQNSAQHGVCVSVRRVRGLGYQDLAVRPGVHGEQSRPAE